jgi:hypothetical protein
MTTTRPAAAWISTGILVSHLAAQYGYLNLGHVLASLVGAAAGAVAYLLWAVASTVYVDTRARRFRAQVVAGRLQAKRVTLRADGSARIEF